MKQTKIICDRCGKEIANTGMVKSDFEECLPVYEVSKVVKIGRGVKECNTLDLCEDCREQLKKWLGGVNFESV